MTDGEIIILLNNRDESVINALTERYGGLCRTLIGNILFDKRDVEECFNSVLLRLWSGIPPAKPSNLTAYVAKTARNEALMRYRSNKTRKLSELLPFEELKDCIPSARNEADAGETAEAIDAFLRKQTAVKRKIFIRRYWFADSIADIAKRNGMSESKVTSILFRLRRELKKYLESEGIEI